MEINKDKEPLLQLARKSFGLTEFRPIQLDAITTILAGRDLMVIMPTGGGKSLIYQLPALCYNSGIVLVISPLIALMKDQVEFLQAMGVAAGCSHSGQDELDQMRVLSHAVTEKIKILYVSPERALSTSFQEVAVRMKVKLVAIDEAHCVSKWGHDFRPEYRQLHRLRTVWRENPPVFAALTATATLQVKNDIIASLKLKDPRILGSSFYRPNLQFSVRYPADEVRREAIMLSLLEQEGFRNRNSGRAILYCATRKKVDHVYKIIKENGFRVGYYHAGRSAGVREKTQDLYREGYHNILVATNAFGMGVDQPDVRLVLHLQTPDSLEAYYQEAGRAGRDGKASRCILLYHAGDFAVRSFLNRKRSGAHDNGEALEAMRHYALSSQCRAQLLSGHFGEEISPCGVCDSCRSEERDAEKLRAENQESLRRQKREGERAVLLSQDERDTVRQLFAQGLRLGKSIAAGALHGSKSASVKRKGLLRHPLFGTLSHIPAASLQREMETMLASGELQLTTGKYPRLYSPMAKDGPASRGRIELPVAGKGSSRSSVMRSNVSGKREGRGASSSASNLKADLLEFRDRKARSMKWKRFMVLQKAVIQGIVDAMPSNADELARVKGMGSTKVVRFGPEILEIVGKYQ